MGCCPGQRSNGSITRAPLAAGRWIVKFRIHQFGVDVFEDYTSPHGCDQCRDDRRSADLVWSDWHRRVKIENR